MLAVGHLTNVGVLCTRFEYCVRVSVSGCCVLGCPEIVIVFGLVVHGRRYILSAGLCAGASKSFEFVGN